MSGYLNFDEANGDPSSDNSSSKLKEQKTNRQHKSAPNSAMNSRTMLLVVACAIVGIASAKPVAEEAKKMVGVDLPREQLIHRQRQLDLVGTIEGKTFYADRAALVTWESAGLICWSGGLHLASITSAAQYNFLVARLSDDGYYWTGGRDALDERQVVWQDTNGAVIRYGEAPGIFDIRTAVSFHPEFDHFDLEAVNIGNYVLCETH